MGWFLSAWLPPAGILEQKSTGTEGLQPQALGARRAPHGL